MNPADDRGLQDAKSRLVNVTVVPHDGLDGMLGLGIDQYDRSQVRGYESRNAMDNQTKNFIKIGLLTQEFGEFQDGCFLFSGYMLHNS